MNRSILALLAVALGVLAACQRPSATSDGSGGHGRYLGVGIYSPQRPWTRLVDAQRAAQTPAAKPVDDQAIIVTQDSRTGEVRACGDLSGYCVGIDPWKTPLAANRLAPVSLSAHMAEPSHDDEAKPPGAR